MGEVLEQGHHQLTVVVADGHHLLTIVVADGHHQLTIVGTNITSRTATRYWRDTASACA
jgi:hypothetical protein